MPVLKLTAELIAEHLQCPPGKTRIEFCDSEVPGLYAEVRVTAPGHGTYYLRYKDPTGKTCHQKIGRTVEITLLDARRKARQLKAEIALGADPRGQVKAEKAVITWDDFFEAHYLPYVKPRKRSWARDEQLHRLRIKAKFGGRRLNQISRHEIQQFHTSLLDDGLSPASADHHLRLIKRCFNLAVSWDLVDKNPAERVPLLRVDNKVENYLNAEQLAALLEVLRTDSARGVCQIALFLLSTGARLSEALKATWDQIDRANRVWRIPATNSKSKRMRSVPLNDSAIEVLDAVDTEGKFDHVFINHRWKNEDGSMGRPYTTIHKVWEKLREKAGLPHLRVHDLRHQYASLLVNAGRSLYEVQQVLGHSDPSVTTRYAHLSSKSLQDAANSASVIIKASMKVPEAEGTPADPMPPGEGGADGQQPGPEVPAQVA